MSELFAVLPSSLSLGPAWASIGAPMASVWTCFPFAALALTLVMVVLCLGLRAVERSSGSAAVTSEDSPEQTPGYCTYKRLVIYASHVCTALIFIWMVLSLRNGIFGPMPATLVPDREAILQYELDKAKRELEDLKRLLDEQSKLRSRAARCGWPSDRPGEMPSRLRAEGAAYEHRA